MDIGRIVAGGCCRHNEPFPTGFQETVALQATTSFTTKLEQVKQGKKKDPDEINKVPIEAGILDHSGTLRTQLIKQQDGKDD